MGCCAQREKMQYLPHGQNMLESPSKQRDFKEERVLFDQDEKDLVTEDIDNYEQEEIEDNEEQMEEYRLIPPKQTKQLSLKELLNGGGKQNQQQIDQVVMQKSNVEGEEIKQENEEDKEEIIT